MFSANFKQTSSAKTHWLRNKFAILNEIETEILKVIFSTPKNLISIHDTTALSIAALSITTLNTTALYATLSINDTQHKAILSVTVSIVMISARMTLTISLL